MNLHAKQRLTDLENKFTVASVGRGVWEGWREGIVREFGGDMYSL